jgi:Zn-dependent protease with chaperone function
VDRHALADVSPAPAADEVDRAAHWRGWSAVERESFFAAIARHRRVAWRVTLASRLANLLTILIVAILMAPLFYAVLALLLDVINILVPATNLVTKIGDVIGPAVDAPETLTIREWLEIAAIAALPGLLWMTGVAWGLARALPLTSQFAHGELAARAPSLSVLPEQRFADVVGEMAIAAGITAPQVRIAERAACNAAAFGSDERHATVLVTTGLLALLDREQMQGIAAHLVASIADGDMTIGLRVATTQCLFGLVTRFSAAFTDSAATRRMSGNLCVAMFRPNGAVARALLDELTNPLEAAAPADKQARAHRKPKRRNEWRMLLWIPFAGPVLITGFVCAIVSMVLLEPLVSLAWRQRKYMADAIAVRLTRAPDTLASALAIMSRAGGGGLLGAWAAHLSVTRPAGRGDAGAMRASLVPSFPSITRRLRALEKMGAHVNYVPGRRPVKALLIVAPLAAIAAGLMAFALVMMVILSAGLSTLLLGLPFGILHMLLRALGH